MSNVPVTILSNTSGYSYQLTSNTGTGSFGGFTNTNTANISVPSDQYNVSLTDLSTSNVFYTGSLNTATSTSLYAPAKATTDSATNGLSTTPIQSGTFGSNSALANTISPTVSSEEYIPANSNFGKYFTCEDARIYIGNLFIDESIFVQFTLQDNQIPMYGYRSRFYDGLAQGRSIVQGQLGLNFVSEGYLATALGNYQKTMSTAANGSQARLNSLVFTESQLIANQSITSTNASDVSVPTISSNSQQLQLIQQEKLKLINQLGPSSLGVAQSYVASVTTPSLSDTPYSNAVYMSAPFDLVLQLTGAQRTVTRKLEGCKLIANDQVIDTSGNTLSDGYSFIARRLR